MEMDRGGLVLRIPLIATAVVGTIVLVTFFVFPRNEKIYRTHDNFIATSSSAREVVAPENNEITRQTIEDELPKPVAVNIPQAPTQTEVAKIIPPLSQENEPVPLPEVLCKSNPNPVFTNHITDITKFSQIKPPPNKDTAGNLKTHSYIETHGARVPVYAPVDMTLIGGAYYIGGPYSLDFRVSCEVRLRLGHISEPLEEIKSILPDTPAPQNDSRGQEIKREIFFRAGDIIAYTIGTNPGAGNWDFGVYNSTVKNRYADDAKYNWSDINTTAVCPFQYFSPELKDIYKQKFDFSGYGSLDPDGESFCAGI